MLFSHRKDFDLAQVSLHQVDSLKRILRDAPQKKQPELLVHIGYNYSYLDSFVQALYYLNKALTFGNELNNQEVVTSAHYQLGDLYFHFDNYTKAQEHFLKAYNLAVQHKNVELIIYSSAGLGGVYTEIEDWNSAKKYVDISLKKAKESNYKHDIPKILNLVSIILIGSNQIDSSIVYFNDILRLSIDLQDSFLMGCAYNNLASDHIRKGNYQEAVSLLNNSYKIHTVHSKSKAVATILSNLGKSYIQLRDYKNAFDALELCRTISNKQGYLSLSVEVYKSLSTLYDSIGDYRKSLENFKLHSIYKDSLFNIEKHRQIQNLVVQNQQEQNDKKLALMKQQAVNRNLIIYFSVFAIMFLVTLLLMFYRSFKLKIKLQEIEKTKMNSQIEQLNRELTSLAMNLEQKKQLLTQVQETIKDIKKASDNEPIKDFLNNINSKFKADNYLEHNWESFLKHFNSVHPSFFEVLQSRHSDLNVNDLKHCAYIKLNMGLKEIAIMNNINVKSVHMIRYRLKRKLGLDPDSDLTNYVNQVN